MDQGGDGCSSPSLFVPEGYGLLDSMRAPRSSRCVICDVCGRDNADSLIFCQECGRRLRVQKVVEPTPPNGVPIHRLEQAAPELALGIMADASVEDLRMTPIPPSGSDSPSQRRASRPSAPEFSFSRNADVPSPGQCGACRSPNPPDYRFCVTCGAPLKRNPEPAEGRSTDAPAPQAPPAAPARKPPPLPPAALAFSRAKLAPAAAPASVEQIVGAPVVDIAASNTAPAKFIVCGRCHGHCAAGTRFCKFCGALLDEAAGRKSSEDLSAERVAPIVPPEPVEQVKMESAAVALPPGRAPASALIVEPTLVESREPVLPDESPTSAVDSPPPATPEPSRPALEVPVLRRISAPSAAKQRGRLVVIVEDGSEGRSFPLAEDQLDIGRTEGDILLDDDLYVSPRHARLHFVGGSWILRDLDSTNHVYIRLRKAHPLRDADLLLLGLEVLQFQTVSDGERGLGHAIQHGTLLFGSPATPRRARLCQRTVEGVARDVYHLFRDETVIGRETGDIVFTADPFLSRRHAMIRRNPVTGEFSVVDLDSSNGTYVAIRSEVHLSDGDFLRIGQHLFRFEWTSARS